MNYEIQTGGANFFVYYIKLCSLSCIVEDPERSNVADEFGKISLIPFLHDYMLMCLK